MSGKPDRDPTTGDSTNKKPHSGVDLDDLGLARDYYYQHFINHDNCGRCGETRFSVKWIKGWPVPGWRYTCNQCRQYWTHPRSIDLPRRKIFRDLYEPDK